jgi:hypothetical protein
VSSAARLGAYAEGVLDGFEIVLKLVGGEEPIDGAEPYRGPVPVELRAWLDKALARVAAEKRS